MRSLTQLSRSTPRSLLPVEAVDNNAGLLKGCASLIVGFGSFASEITRVRISRATAQSAGAESSEAPRPIPTKRIWLVGSILAGHHGTLLRGRHASDGPYRGDGGTIPIAPTRI